MHAPRPSLERKSLARRAFEHYLRTGRKYYIDQESPALVQKNNPYHDPDNGQFTSGPGGSRLGPKETGTANPQSSQIQENQGASKPAKEASDKSKSVDKPPRSGFTYKEIGAVSADFESRNGKVGAVSKGKGDDGGVSYGTYQLSSNRGTVQDFLKSDEAEDFKEDFKDLEPATEAFNQKWKEVAKRDPEKFEQAQTNYIGRTHHKPVVDTVIKSTGKDSKGGEYDISKASMAVQSAVFSTAVQHGSGNGATLIRRALSEADKKFKRKDKRFEEEFITNIYDQRTNIAIRSRYRAISSGNTSKANQQNNIINNRYPTELSKILAMME